MVVVLCVPSPRDGGCPRAADVSDSAQQGGGDADVTMRRVAGRVLSWQRGVRALSAFVDRPFTTALELVKVGHRVRVW